MIIVLSCSGQRHITHETVERPVKKKHGVEIFFVSGTSIDCFCLFVSRKIGMLTDFSIRDRC